MGGPMEGSIVFWILAVVVLVSGALVVSLRNIFHCAIFLIVCLSGVAGIFIMLHAEFLAAAQILIYVGAVSILMIFAVMLTAGIGKRNIIATNKNAVVAFAAVLGFVICVTVLVWKTGELNIWQYTDRMLPADNVLMIGKLLMTEFMLPFEVVSVLLLASLIGAIVLARQEGS